MYILLKNNTVWFALFHLGINKNLAYTYLWKPFVAILLNNAIPLEIKLNIEELIL